MHKLLDVLLEELAVEVNDPAADRSQRPDLDPQMFTALTIATIRERKERAEAWRQALAESPAMRNLAEMMPSILERLVAVVERFESRQHDIPELADHSLEVGIGIQFLQQCRELLSLAKQREHV